MKTPAPSDVQHRTVQPSLFTPGRLTLEEEFRLFHDNNPHVYAALRELALDLVRRGVRRYSIAGLFEVLRYQRSLATDDPASAFKLNNDYRSFYARELMRREPRLAGFFELRTQTWQSPVP